MRLKTISATGFCTAALIAPPALAQPVGVASAVDQSAQGTVPNGARRLVKLGQKVIHNERIDTDHRGLLQILLADGTSFTVGPNSSLTIDSFVYDPDAGKAKVTASLSKGVFRFVGGLTSKSPDGAKLDTPVGTVGIRGGIVDLDLRDRPGASKHISMHYGESVNLLKHGKRVAKLYHNGYSIVIDKSGQAKIEKTRKDWVSAFRKEMSGKGKNHGGRKEKDGDKIELARQLPHPRPRPKPGVSHRPSGLAPAKPKNEWAAETTTTPSTWADIYNTSLAGNYASYHGTMTGTVRDGSTTTPATGTFALTYHFDTSNGGGTFSTNDFGGHDFSVNVGPDSYGSGEADFSGQGSTVGPGSSAFEAVTGTFTNTGGGPASGVDGEFHEWSSGTWGATGTYSGPRTSP